MSKIVVKGYVNKPQTKTSSKGVYSVFTVAEKQKNYNADDTRNYFNVTAWKEPTPPEESSFVEVEGFLNFRKYTKDDQERVSYDVTAQKITVVGGSNNPSTSEGSKGTEEKDPWE